MVNLYQKNTGAQKSALSNIKFTPEQLAAFGDVSSLPMSSSGTPDFSQLRGMGNREFKQLIKNLTPEQQQQLYSNPDYFNSYQNPFNITNQ
jgi:hypothetical protein